MAKNKRGGKRAGAGAPQKYGESTKTVAYRVPESKADQVTDLINELRKKWKLK